MITAFHIHHSKAIQAKADHVGDTHWVDLKFGHGNDRLEIGVFFDDAALADRYAAAINGVSIDVPTLEPAE